MKNIALLLLIPAVTIMLSCGGGGSSSGPQISEPDDNSPDPQGLLIALETQEQLLETVRQSFTQVTAVNMPRTDTDEMVAEAVMDSAVPTSSASFTTTYTLEANVDEHDYVKYDGDHLFIAPSRGMDCCFTTVDDLVFIEPISEEGEPLAADAIPAPGPDEERSIRILATDTQIATANQVGSIPLTSNRTVEGLYINDNQLVSISSSSWWGRWWW